MKRGVFALLFACVLIMGSAASVMAEVTFKSTSLTDCPLWWMYNWEGFKGGERVSGSIIDRAGNYQATLQVSKLQSVWVIRNDGGGPSTDFTASCPQNSFCSYTAPQGKRAQSSVEVNISKNIGIVIKYDGNVVKVCQ